MSKLVVLNGDYYTGHNTELNVLTFEPDRKKAKLLSKEALGLIINVIMSWIAEDIIELKRLEILSVRDTMKAVND